MRAKKKKVTKKTAHKKAVSKKINVTRDKPVKKVIVVHGWDGDIKKNWYPWLEKTLKSQGFEVIMKQMPHSDTPTIQEWVLALKKNSGTIDENTYFIGHSVGCQTIMRMLEKSDVEKIGGVIFLAGWFVLKDYTYKQHPNLEKEVRRIAAPWISTPIDFDVVQSKLNPGKITAIFSDNDYYVDVKNAEIYKQKLDARIIVESNRGHYAEQDNITTVPLIVEELLRISQK